MSRLFKTAAFVFVVNLINPFICFSNPNKLLCLNVNPYSAKHEGACLFTKVIGIYYLL